MSSGKEIPPGCPHPAPSPALTQQGWLPAPPMSQAHPQANSLALTCPCCQGSAQCLVWGCSGAASAALLQAGVMGWVLTADPCPTCPWGAPMALVPSREGASIPCKYITGHPKWESLFLFYFRLRNEQGKCLSPLPHAGSVGHSGTASRASRSFRDLLQKQPCSRLWASMVPTAVRPSAPRGIPTALLPPCWPMC